MARDNSVSAPLLLLFDHFFHIIFNNQYSISNFGKTHFRAYVCLGFIDPLHFPDTVLPPTIAQPLSYTVMQQPA